MEISSISTRCGANRSARCTFAISCWCLGYSILQIRAVDASSEALSRSQGMLIARTLAENMRANPAAQTNYPAAVRGYTNITAAPTAPTTPSCSNNLCTPAQMARFDAFMAARSAF